MTMISCAVRFDSIRVATCRTVGESVCRTVGGERRRQPPSIVPASLCLSPSPSPASAQCALAGWQLCRRGPNPLDEFPVFLQAAPSTT